MRRKYVIVAKGLSSNPLNISFRRAIVGDRLKDWLSLVFLVLPIYFKENKGEDIAVTLWSHKTVRGRRGRRGTATDGGVPVTETGEGRRRARRRRVRRRCWASELTDEWWMVLVGSRRS